MKEIPLSQGKVALVDDSDFDSLSERKWSACLQHGRWYAARHITQANGTRPITGMHRQILGLAHGDGALVDHKNGNGLDNRRTNLRLCSYSENGRNSKPFLSSRSSFKGVSGVTGSDRSAKPWRAQITASGSFIHIGHYATEEEAARAYDYAALVLFGEFARTNFDYSG